MTQTLIEQYVDSSDNMRVFQQERAIYSVTELIESVMNAENISRSELARKLRRNKSWVTQLLDGEANKTVRTIADVLAVMGREFRSFAVPIRIGGTRQPPISEHSNESVVAFSDVWGEWNPVVKMDNIPTGSTCQGVA